MSARPQPAQGSITVAEAAQISGKSPSTIKRWIANGTLPALRTKDGYHLVAHEQLMGTLAQTSGRSKVQASAHHAPMDELIGELRARIRTLEDQNNRLSQRNERLEEKNEQLHSEILRLTAEITAFLNKNEKTYLSRWRKVT